MGVVYLPRTIYPPLLKTKRERTLHARAIDNVIAAAAEGYPFPANLDIDSPLSGMAPPSQQDLMRKAIDEDWPEDTFEAELKAQASRKRSH